VACWGGIEDDHRELHRFHMPERGAGVSLADEWGRSGDASRVAEGLMLDWGSRWTNRLMRASGIVERKQASRPGCRNHKLERVLTS
jgi:hypothetical protein